MLKKFVGWLARRAGADGELRKEVDGLVDLSATLLGRNHALQDTMIAAHQRWEGEVEAFHNLLAAVVLHAGGGPLEVPLDLVDASKGWAANVEVDEARRVVKVGAVEPPDAGGGDDE